MSASQKMTTAQTLPVGVTLLGQGTPPIPYTSLDELPGWAVTFESSDPSVVGVVVREDGLNADLTSDNVGTATITITVTKPDGTALAGTPDVTEVTVVNALPGNANVTFGAPVDE
jgi:hypothetical protein